MAERPITRVILTNSMFEVVGAFDEVRRRLDDPTARDTDGLVTFEVSDGHTVALDPAYLTAVVSAPTVSAP